MSMRKGKKNPAPAMPFSPMCDRCGAMLGAMQEAKHAAHHAEQDLLRTSVREWSVRLAEPPQPDEPHATQTMSRADVARALAATEE